MYPWEPTKTTFGHILNKCAKQPRSCVEGQEKLAIFGVILLKSLAYPIVDSATKCWVRRVFPGPKLPEFFKSGVRFEI